MDPPRAPAGMGSESITEAWEILARERVILARERETLAQERQMLLTERAGMVAERASWAEERRTLLGLITSAAAAVSTSQSPLVASVPSIHPTASPAALLSMVPSSERAHICISYQSGQEKFMKRLRDGIEAANFICADGTRVPAGGDWRRCCASQPPSLPCMS